MFQILSSILKKAATDNGYLDMHKKEAILGRTTVEISGKKLKPSLYTAWLQKKFLVQLSESNKVSKCQLKDFKVLF